MTVNVCDTPAVAVEGRPDRTNWLAAAGLTLIPESVPVMATFVVSVAVIDWLPAVLSVTVNVYVPSSADVKVKVRRQSGLNVAAGELDRAEYSRCRSPRSSSRR